MARTSKQGLTAILLIVGVLSVGGYYGYRYYFAPERNINRFAGQVVKIEGERIFASGVFKSRSGPLPRPLSSVRSFIFRINSATIFTKETVRWPTSQELKDIGGKFDLKDLPRETIPGTFEEMNRLFGAGNTTYIDADFSASIDKSLDAIASDVLYRVFLEPPAESDITP